jgi:hypothetical protein
MGTLFLTTILSYQQVMAIANRLVSINLLSAQQKTEILIELRKTVPSCPLIIKPNDTKRNSGNR